VESLRVGNPETNVLLNLVIQWLRKAKSNTKNPAKKPLNFQVLDDFFLSQLLGFG
jgi:hypothetical protein